MIIKANLEAMNSNRMMNLTTSVIAKSTEKLSSGYKINRSADDAAGLAISEKMRRQIRGLTQASNNAQDGVSFVQIADGALDEVHSMLNRSEQLAVQAANGTLTDTDRSYLQSEIDQIQSEIDRIAEITNFNEISIFPSDGHHPDDSISAMKTSDVSNKIEIEWSFVASDGTKVASTAEVQDTGVTTSYKDSDAAKFVMQAADDAISKLSSAYPNLLSKTSSNGIKIGLNFANIDGKGNTLASAALSMSASSSSAMMSYTLNIDTSDYQYKDFDKWTDAQKADLAATIAHEMTHIVMYDTNTDGMLSNRSTSFPNWIVEGIAQTSSGDGGWLSNRLNESSTEADIKSYMSKLTSMPYGAGYAAAMYLGYEAGDSSKSLADRIKDGLDKFLSEASDKSKTLDDAINNVTSRKYASISAFESAFKSGAADALDFVKNTLIPNMYSGGSAGAGSILASDLGVNQAAAFAPASLTGTATNYKVDSSSTRFSNAYGAGYTFPPKGSGNGGNADGGDDIFLQIGAEANQHLNVMRFAINTGVLFDGNPMDVSTQDEAENTINKVKVAGERISKIRSYYGAVQNRLEHTINNLDNVVENTTAAESQIRDTDMATEMVKYSNNNIIAQAGQAMLAQANQSKQGILSLLG